MKNSVSELHISHCLFFSESDGEVKFLLWTKNSIEHNNLIQPFWGKQLPKETSLAALRRELEEEVFIPDFDPCDVLEEIWIFRAKSDLNKKIIICISCFVHKIDTILEAQSQEKGIIDPKWYTLGEILSHPDMGTLTRVMSASLMATKYGNTQAINYLCDLDLGSFPDKTEELIVGFLDRVREEKSRNLTNVYNI